MFKNAISKFRLGFGKVSALAGAALVAAGNVSAETLSIPSSAETQLTGYISDNFGIVIGVVIVIVGASLLIRMIRKAGNG